MFSRTTQAVRWRVHQDDRLHLFIGASATAAEIGAPSTAWNRGARGRSQAGPDHQYNPFGGATNIVASQHVINAAIVAAGPGGGLSTVKAVNPISLYGASKLCAEKLFVAGNSYAASSKARLSVVRYGNVMGSRGSVVPLFLAKRKEGVLPITDERMTRFWITLEQSIQLVLYALKTMHGGEVFVPKIPSIRMVDLAKAMAPECKIRFVGIRPGEKLHEVLLTEDEAGRAIDMGGVLVIKPQFQYWDGGGFWGKGKPVPPDFRYASDTNDQWPVDKLRGMVGPSKPPRTERPGRLQRASSPT